jgi:hypothetical protein
LKPNLAIEYSWSLPIHSTIKKIKINAIGVFGNNSGTLKSELENISKNIDKA